MNGEQKKFLDENGLKILWNQISMHDYPNNAALTSVINAIDANKADKTDIPKIDTTLSAAGAAADAKAVGQAIENIELTPGPKGDSGVYVGASAPTDESVSVWINPNGEAIDLPSGGGNSEWRLAKTITLEQDVTEFSLDVSDIPAKELFVAYSGGVNDAASSGQGGYASIRVLINNVIAIWSSPLSYVTNSGYFTLHITQRGPIYHVTGELYSGGKNSTAQGQCNGAVPNNGVEPLSSIRLFTMDNGRYFKSGATMEVWAK